MSIFIYISQLENCHLRKIRLGNLSNHRSFNEKIVYNIVVTEKRISRMKHEIIGEERTSF